MQYNPFVSRDPLAPIPFGEDGMGTLRSVANDQYAVSSGLVYLELSRRLSYIRMPGIALAYGT